MRWGDTSASTESLRWVRPLQGIVALLGEEIVGIEIAGVKSGAATVGHRFHHPGIITIGSANDYAEKLRACHVIIDPAERRRIIAEGAAAAARDAGLTLVEDEGLLQENAGLTEWPVPLLGHFDPSFLDVPREVIQLTMRTNQKYFACTDRAGNLAPNFICTANIDAADGGAAIVQGNRKVLAARLSDAKFFWEQDLKVPLEEQAKKLGQIVFHEKLGTVADKVERVAKLARWLVEEGIVQLPLPGGERVGVRGLDGAGKSHAPDTLTQPSPSRERASLADQAETAARLSKADLVTGMVGEFPELQGIIGGYLARAQGHSDAVADAIRDHYKPVGQGDEVPTAPVTVAVSLADKLDTLVSFFSIGERPTGSKDPFALRRAAIAIIRLMVEREVRWSIGDLVREARGQLVASAGKRHAVISIDEDAPGSALVAVQPATQHLTTPGQVFVVSWDAEAQDSIIIDDVGYPAYSRDYLQDHGLTLCKIGSLIDVVGNLVQYFGDRIEEAQRAQGIRIDLIRSVLPREYLILDLLAPFSGHKPRQSGPGVAKFQKRNWSSSDDPVEILARVRALQAFVETAEGADLLAGYKRAANILKKEGWTAVPLPGREGLGVGVAEGDQTPDGGGSLRSLPTPDPSLAGRGEEKTLSYTPLPEEARLIAALDSAEPRARTAVEAEDFEGAMAALAMLRAPVDAFFDKVTVNDPDPAKRAARLNLLSRMRDAVHEVADFSRIEG